MRLPKKGKGIKALGKMSGLSVSAIKDIWEDVKKNHSLLDSCSYHIFVNHPSPNMSRKYICNNCKGIVDTTQKVWYEKGIDHSQPREEVK